MTQQTMDLVILSDSDLDQVFEKKIEKFWIKIFVYFAMT